jgi:hypothetical protein
MSGISASRGKPESLLDLLVFFELEDVHHLAEPAAIAEPEFAFQHRSGVEKHWTTARNRS